MIKPTDTERLDWIVSRGVFIEYDWGGEYIYVFKQTNMPFLDTKELGSCPISANYRDAIDEAMYNE